MTNTYSVGTYYQELPGLISVPFSAEPRVLLHDSITVNNQSQHAKWNSFASPKVVMRPNDHCLPPRSLSALLSSISTAPFWCQDWNWEQWIRAGRGSEEALWEGKFAKRRLGRACHNQLSHSTSSLSFLPWSFFCFLLTNSFRDCSPSCPSHSSFSFLLCSIFWPSVSLSPLPTSFFPNFLLTFPPAFFFISFFNYYYYYFL